MMPACSCGKFLAARAEFSPQADNDPLIRLPLTTSRRPVGFIVDSAGNVAPACAVHGNRPAAREPNATLDSRPAIQPAKPPCDRNSSCEKCSKSGPILRRHA